MGWPNSTAWTACICFWGPPIPPLRLWDIFLSPDVETSRDRVVTRGRPTAICSARVGVLLGDGHRRRRSCQVLSQVPEVGSDTGRAWRPAEGACTPGSWPLDSVFLQRFLPSPDSATGRTGSHPAGEAGCIPFSLAYHRLLFLFSCLPEGNSSPRWGLQGLCLPKLLAHKGVSGCLGDCCPGT
ncbi:hypothetical protein HJG60_010005 [Phyllostomus discolor]|uniref:Uncharacterized protein n=1 Tax=Phyllostomus discolor TaxID=89673 RepID=A0A833YB24_9CHIR|nr:hypothetical protein HJG60_010005 [Phyllostomus discolor]